MTNGLAFVYDTNDVFARRINEDVIVERPSLDDPELQVMRELIERHIKLTHSAHAKNLIENWDETVAKTWKVVPPGQA